MPQPTVVPEDIVKVINRMEFPYVVKYDSREFVLQPGKETYIPAACAFTWFGDPRSTNTYQSVKMPNGQSYFISDRKTEVRRLRIKHGAGIEGNEDNFDHVAIPDVEVYTAEGERVLTVLDDPAGKTTTPADVRVSQDEELREIIARQQRQIEAMRDHLGMEDEAEQAAASEAELPRDGELEDVETS